MIANLIPNEHPLYLRHALIHAGKLENEKERRVAVDNATEEIKQRHPGLFWTDEEAGVMEKVWSTARAVRMQNAARSKETSDLLSKSTGGVAHVIA